ncbi:type IV secretion system protein [Allopusillimonas ginsengisoli]|nr:type IV secretion system protein [Allopusillimonas ginsengisoli]
MAGGFNTATVTAPSDSGSIAQWITNQTDAVLQSAVAQPIEQLTTALLPIITMGLTLQFLAYAFAIMHGQGGMTVTEFFKKAIMVAIIATVATAGGLYQTDISKTMLSLPDDLTAVVTGNTTVAAEVDKLQKKTTTATERMGSAGGESNSWYSVLPSTKEVFVGILTFVVTINSAVVGAAIAVIMVVIKVGMALVVATGPLFIAGLLFEPTKKLFDSWVAQALNFIFLALLAGLIFAILLQMNLQFIEAMAKFIDEGETNLLALLAGQLLVGIASIAVMLMLPGLAAGLSGGFGAQMGIGAAGRGAFTAMRISRMLPRIPKGK